MIRIIPRSEYLTIPWKNAGGITHEILKRQSDGRIVLRLSVAEVAQDGPFSLFPGLTRILTVIHGTGMYLRGDDVTVLPALPLQPVQFAGDLQLYSVLMDGPCRDFNLMFDAALFDVQFKVIVNVEAMPDADLNIHYRVDGDTALSDGESFPACDETAFLISLWAKHPRAARFLTVA
jgi:environmental stress-induced protein Ves